MTPILRLGLVCSTPSRRPFLCALSWSVTESMTLSEIEATLIWLQLAWFTDLVGQFKRQLRKLLCQWPVHRCLLRRHRHRHRHRHRLLRRLHLRPLQRRLLQRRSLLSSHRSVRQDKDVIDDRKIDQSWRFRVALNSISTSFVNAKAKAKRRQYKRTASEADKACG